MTNKRTSAIIQARMGSTRLPHKVLMDLAGKPVLWHIVHRLRKCRNVDDIVLATSWSPENDPLVAFAFQEKIDLIRGSEDDVLDRYSLAAAAVGADVIVRVTGDAPLIDPEIIDLLIATLIEQDADYCFAQADFPTIYEGFVPFSRRALDWMVEHVADDPVAREHVSSYIPKHPEQFKIVTAPANPAHRFDLPLRLSVDTPADLLFLETVYQELQVPAGEADSAALVQLLNRKPELLQINCHVQQKSVQQRSLQMIVRCDGYPEIGLGHVVRCLTLAEQLRDRCGVGILFAMTAGTKGVELVQRQGFPTVERSVEEDEGSWLAGLLKSKQADALILDIRTDLAAHWLAQYRESCLVVSLDDPSPRRLQADLVFYPPVPQVSEMDWTDGQGEWLAGWEWLLLRPEFGHLRHAARIEQKTLLVAMGGSDPAALTILTLQALAQLPLADWRINVVLGAGFSHEEALQQQLASAPFPCDLLRDVKDMASLMARADFAVASFGLTAYELAAARVPAILLSLSPDHAASASAIARVGGAISLGDYRSIDVKTLGEAINDLIRHPQKRETMRENLQGLVDGRGAERIAETILDRLEKRHG